MWLHHHHSLVVPEGSQSTTAATTKRAASVKTISLLRNGGTTYFGDFEAVTTRTRIVIGFRFSIVFEVFDFHLVVVY